MVNNLDRSLWQDFQTFALLYWINKRPAKLRTVYKTCFCVAAKGRVTCRSWSAGQTRLSSVRYCISRWKRPGPLRNQPSTLVHVHYISATMFSATKVCHSDAKPSSRFYFYIFQLLRRFLKGREIIFFFIFYFIFNSIYSSIYNQISYAKNFNWNFTQCKKV